MGLGNGGWTPEPVYHCTTLLQKHQAAEVPWTLWVLRIACESMKKINNNALSSWVRKQGGLGTSGCSWYAYANLKFIILITEENEMLNTMNMASVLQGKDPPPFVNDLNYIWNISWRLITHLIGKGRTHPPYCFSVKWKPTKRWKMNESGFGKN